jgi:hypothetical protein
MGLVNYLLVTTKKCWKCEREERRGEEYRAAQTVMTRRTI